MIRKTRQREAIRSVIDESTRPLSPMEVLIEGQKFIPRLGIATVYRALRELSDEGLIAAVELPGQTVCYESAHMEHHHHFKCRTCYKIFDVEGCLREIDQLNPEGFLVESHEIFFFGQCPACLIGSNK